MPQVITGAQQLLQDISGWLLILIPLAGVMMVGYHSLMKTLSDGDPATIAEKNRKIKQTLIGVVIGMSAAGLVSAIITYFV